MPCGTKEVAAATCGSAPQAPPSERIGMRDMDSTPPATIMSAWPAITLAAAMLQASSPEAQKRLIWTPAVSSA